MANTSDHEKKDDRASCRNKKSSQQNAESFSILNSKKLQYLFRNFSIFKNLRWSTKTEQEKLEMFL